MKNLRNLFLFALAALALLSCQPKAKVEQINNGAQLSTVNVNLKVQFYSDNIVRVTKWSPDGTSEKKSLVIVDYTIPQVDVSLTETSAAVELKSKALTVTISKADGVVCYTKPDGSVIVTEQGAPMFTPVVYDADSGFSMQQNFKLSTDEGVYGLGQHQDGYFNYRGKKVELVQSNCNAVNPFLISTQNYGILWDNYSQTIFNDDTSGASFWSDMGDNIDYYLVSANDMDGVISGYRTLTGKAPMYGKFAFGYWQSKEHYDTQAELMAVAKEYRKRKIPIDNMVQDWDYWNGAENWSGMFFDKTLFPDPEGMMKDLHKMNYHAIISIWPALGSNTEINHEMDKQGFLFPTIGWAGFKYYDPYKPGATELYWRYLKGGIYSKGLDGWWIDSTEPDVINAMTKQSSAYELKRMGSNYLGSFARYLNTFSLVMNEKIYKFWREETSDRRLFILTRSCFAGQQRAAATTWSGDIGASWEIYRNQISAGVNHCMAGIPYWTFDIGAFVLGSYDGVFAHGGNDPAYQEFYTRMFQFGSFCPIFRSHGSDTPREMWYMGQYEPVLIKFDNLRYRLLPYIYSLSWKVTNYDYTIMRGLPMDFPADKNTYSIDDQYMFGPSIMVCPVTTNMYHRAPVLSLVIGAGNFKTADGQQGLKTCYYKDTAFSVLSKECIEPNVNADFYGGRPDYVTDSMYSIRWEGKLVVAESGKYKFHTKSYDKHKVYLDGKEVKVSIDGNEKYYEMIDLEKGKEYDIKVEVVNNQTGAARMVLKWKTPADFALDAQPLTGYKTKEVYLPAGKTWYDFWTGKAYDGGQKVVVDAPIEKMPLMVPAGSIIPMGPFVQYATEKPADPIELRIYPGANGSFILYEDENDNYNYEKGIYSTIEFTWNDDKRILTIGERKGSFPGMLDKRTFNVTIVNEGIGSGVEISTKVDNAINYTGEKLDINF